MDERVVQFRVGVMVLATLIIAVILALLFGELPSLMQDTYKVHIHFPDAPGVTKDTPVTKSGILIGRVVEVRFAPDSDGVIVTAEIDANRKIPRTDICRISKSLLGDARVQFIGVYRPKEAHRHEPEGKDATAGAASQTPLLFVQPVSYQAASPAQPEQGAPAEPDEPAVDIYLKEGDVIVGEVEPEPLEVVIDLQKNLSKAIDSVATTSSEFRQFIRQIGGLLENNEERINNILRRSDAVTADLQGTLNSINAIVGDEGTRRQLQEAIARLPALMQDTHQTINNLGETTAIFERSLNNISGFTGELGTTGPQILARLDRGSERLDDLIGELLVFSQSLNQGQGTISRLVNDPQLYDEITQTVENVEDLVTKLRPILNDARVFSDKIARHPEVLGLRGAIQRNPGIK